MAGKRRDNFKARTVTTLAKRVGYFCSNPDCNAHTSGPHQDASDSSNVGVAAHICAASPGGPRYRLEMTTDARCSAENGIWLCQNCAAICRSSHKERWTLRNLPSRLY